MSVSVEGMRLLEGTAVEVGLDQVLPLVATGSTLLLMRFGWVLVTGERSSEHRPAGELVSWLVVCAAGVSVPWLISAGVGATEPWLPVADFSWEVYALWNAVWPILLGIALGALIWWLASRALLPRWVREAGGSVVQPGDLIAAEESLVVRGMRAGGQGLDAVHERSAAARAVSARAGVHLGYRGRRLAGTAETRLGAWESSGLATLGLVVGAIVLMLVAGRWFGG
ncbi:hypothetical protein [Nesterenkonia flava]|uniref:Uncharacterized protein n=1 Tax=Nesterenkonia flava TaxID=469799 RepID=A0ABU1FWY2_9MICC|nr:hypothetical protein [Nesterenkonia flava]MDR5712832.1 hypothetical protein [Nesterenkonia flava]